MEDIFVDNEKERRSNCYNYRRMALQNLLRIIVCHYYLRCSYQLHGSVMATKSFLTCLNLQILRQKIYIAYIHNAMCGYVCFCPSRFFFSGRNRILHTLCKCSKNIWKCKCFVAIIMGRSSWWSAKFFRKKKEIYLKLLFLLPYWWCFLVFAIAMHIKP